MWNRRKEEEPGRYTPSPTPSANIASEGMPVQATPTRPDYEATPTRTATIGKGVTISGLIYSKEDLIVDGEVEGTIEANEHKLTIGPNGKVKAGIKAKEIVIVGIVQGDVEATEKIEIRKDAKLVGNIKTARIAIEDGAVFKGSIDIVRTEAPKAAPRPPVQAAPVEKPQPAQQSIAASAGGGATEAKRDRS